MTPMPDRTDELLDRMERGFVGIHLRLDQLNGRTRTNEVDIAVLQDRSDRSERTTGIVGAITGGSVTGIILAVKAWLGR